MGRTVEAPALMTLTAPGEVVVGERVTVYGGLRVPEGRYQLGVFSCQAGRCARSMGLTIEGPRAGWGSLGSVTFESAGDPATITVRAFRSDDPAGSVVAEWTRPVTVRPAPTGAE